MSKFELSGNMERRRGHCGQLVCHETEWEENKSSP